MGGKRGSGPGVSRAKGRAPKGMHINHDDLATMASGNAGTLLMKSLEREFDSLQRQVSTFLDAPTHLRSRTCY